MGVKAEVVAMDRLQPSQLPARGAVLFVTSTFGDGDPPDNGAAFWSALQSAEIDLSGLSFAVLCLGDSSYGEFCGFGRRLDARLEALGGKRLMQRIDCDGDGETRLSVWLDDLPPLVAPPDDDAAPCAGGSRAIRNSGARSGRGFCRDKPKCCAGGEADRQSQAERPRIGQGDAAVRLRSFRRQPLLCARRLRSASGRPTVPIWSRKSSSCGHRRERTGPGAGCGGNADRRCLETALRDRPHHAGFPGVRRRALSRRGDRGRCRVEGFGGAGRMAAWSADRRRACNGLAAASAR